MREDDILQYKERKRNRKAGSVRESWRRQPVSARKRAHTMRYSRLACDVNASEEAELERLEHGCGDSTGNAHGSPPCGAARACGQPAGGAGATSTVQDQAVQGNAGQVAEAHQVLVRNIGSLKKRSQKETQSSQARVPASRTHFIGK